MKQITTSVVEKYSIDMPRFLKLLGVQPGTNELVLSFWDGGKWYKVAPSVGHGASRIEIEATRTSTVNAIEQESP